MRKSTPQQPAIEFEQEQGFSGIAGHYKFPEEPGFDRLSLQHKIWYHYDTLSDPEILADLVKPFGEALHNPAITLQEIEANENLANVFVRFIEQREHDELTSILGKLEALNPEDIARMRFDRTNTQHLSDVIHGMVSGFNPDDINHYLDRFNGAMCLNDLEKTAPEIERRALESQIVQRLSKTSKHTIGWVASYPTLEKIWKQVKARPLASEEKGAEISRSHSL